MLSERPIPTRDEILAKIDVVNKEEHPEAEKIVRRFKKDLKFLMIRL